jgi:hypothetical protein
VWKSHRTLFVLKLLLVVLASVAFYFGFRERFRARTAAVVWGELRHTSDSGYRPRTAVFDGARNHLQLSAGRGEAVSLLLRLRAEKPLHSVLPRVGKVRSRFGGEPALRVRVLHAGEGGLAVPERIDVPAGTTTAWPVEMEVLAEAKPGAYVAELEIDSAEGILARLPILLQVWRFALPAPALPVVVRGEGLGAEARSFFVAAGVMPAPPFPPGQPLRADPQALRASAWRAVRAGAGWLDAGDAKSYLSAGSGETLALWDLRRAADDLRYLALLRQRGDPMVERVIARVTSGEPLDAEAWEQERSGLAGLLNAPGELADGGAR